MSVLQSLLGSSEELGEKDEAPPREPIHRRMSQTILQTMKSMNVRGHLHEKEHRQYFDLSLLIILYFGCGTCFYRFCDEDFTTVYALFYSVNVGLGVGYGDLHIRDVFTKWFTVFYMMLGSSLVISSMSIFFNSLLQRMSIDSIRTHHHRTLKLAACGTLYAFAVGVGVFDGFYFQKFGNLADALVFAVSNYTTAGLISPKDAFSSLFLTTLTLLIGIPANILWWGQVAHFFLSAYEDSDDFLSSSDSENGSDIDDVLDAKALLKTESFTFTTAASGMDKKRDKSVSFQTNAYQKYLEDQLLKAGVFRSPGHVAQVRNSFASSSSIPP
mmetsp:Transcript_13750/g.20513  ORF Transcript_13750/g.20513 Transcript_13750/m.20513 type:complete len:328 (+) Transcript_13750:69-1052(+)